MQLRSKILFGLIVSVLVLGMASTAQAQVNITIFPNASAVEVASSRAALTSTRSSVGSGLVVSGALVANSGLTTTTLTLTYPGPVTSNAAAAGLHASALQTDPSGAAAALPANDPIKIEGATGIFAQVSLSTIDFKDGKVVFTLPGSPNNTQSGSFRLIGVRVDASGLTAPVNVTAALGDAAANYLLSTTSATVITALTKGIDSLAIGAAAGGTSNGTATVFTNGVVGDSSASLVIKEGFAGAWRTAAQESNSGTALTGNGTRLELTFSGIPAGVTLTIGTANVSSTLTIGTLTDTSLTAATDDNDVTFPLTATSLTAVEEFTITVTLTAPNATSVAAGSITVVADLDPIGTILDSTDKPTTSSVYPSFAASPTAAVTVATIIASKTNMLIPFVVSDGSFDTGISVANTTMDPWAGIGGAAAASGTITAHFYPRTADGVGTAFSLTTSSTVRPGVGLSTDGSLAAGGTWSVLLSELLTAASQSTTFTGYVFMEANFLLAHPTAFVTDFSTFTSASPGLVLNQTQTAARTGFESLGN